MKKVMSGLLLLALMAAAGCNSLRTEADPWQQADKIISNIVVPSFPDRTYDITVYGAVGDGKTDCTKAFAHAIAACTNAGGGSVVVPAGRFLTGAIHLDNNVELHLDNGSVIAFDSDHRKYLPPVLTRWEGMELYNYSPFIYAYDKQNVAITGSGTIDGQGDKEHWWYWCGSDRYGWQEGMPRQNPARDGLQQMVDDEVPVAQRDMTAEGYYLRPQLVQFNKCRNVLIDGVTLQNSAFWVIHPLMSENVTVRNVSVISHGPNNDGCDPESCKNVLIDGCSFDTGDDCIAIKSGRNADGRRINTPSENIVIQNCVMKDGHGGVVLGSELTGGIRNVFARNCQMASPNLERALRIKSNARRGGWVENVYMKDVEVGQVSDAVIRVNMFYFKETGPYLPRVENINVENVNCQKSKYAIYIMALENAPARNMHIKNCTFNNTSGQQVIEYVDGLKLDNVTINMADKK